MSKKGVTLKVIVLVIVGVVVVIGGGYYLTQQRSIPQGECPIGQPNCDDLNVDGTPRPDLTVKAIGTSYSNFTAEICNIGEAAAPSFSVLTEANDISDRIVYSPGLAPNICVTIESHGREYPFKVRNNWVGMVRVAVDEEAKIVESNKNNNELSLVVDIDANNPNPLDVTRPGYTGVEWTNHSKTAGDFEYRIEAFGLRDVVGSDGIRYTRVDQKVIQLNTQTGEEKVIIPSVRDQIDYSSRTVFIKVILDNPPTLILRGANPDSDAGLGSFYNFDLGGEGQLTSMQINEIVSKGFNESIDSPTDKTKIAFVVAENGVTGEARQLYLIDLAKDNYESIAVVSDEESLNRGEGGISFSPVFEWLDGKRIQYSVFEYSTTHDFHPEGDGWTPRPLIGERIINIE